MVVVVMVVVMVMVTTRLFSGPLNRPPVRGRERRQGLLVPARDGCRPHVIELHHAPRQVQLIQKGPSRLTKYRVQG